jgi:dihydrofolate synthase/folylpolyglutamate synthase
MYQRIGSAAFKKDLSNIMLLAEQLGHPERAFKSIHVAGTNGKGSTSHMLAAVFQASGYKVGLYTSPHLKDFRERIKVNGAMIPKDAVTSFIAKYISFFETNSLSFFEMTVGLAYDYFRSERVDLAVIEVGLGGRLDSTNIIIPELSVITNIGLDHTQLLGETISEIAVEKAGIIKEGVPVVIGESVPDSRFVFEQVAEQKLAPIYFAEEMPLVMYTSDLKGPYQTRNIRTVAAAISVLRASGWDISQHSIKLGLQQVAGSTGLMGRWQLLSSNPRVLCDTAHNREGLSLVLEQLQKEKFSKLHIVLGVVNDKNLDRILDLFPQDATYYFCSPDVPRGLDVGELKNAAARFSLFGEVYNSVRTALEAAANNAEAEDLIFIGGSTFTVAEVV